MLLGKSEYREKDFQIWEFSCNFILKGKLSHDLYSCIKGNILTLFIIV